MKCKVIKCKNKDASISTEGYCEECYEDLQRIRLKDGKKNGK